MADTATALFAGGNFHDLEAPFDRLPGVISTEAGYTGDDIQTVRVSYDTEKVGYDTLLTTYWRNIDPFDKQGQFCDQGQSFRPVIYPGSDSEKALAQESLAAHQRRFNTSVTVTIGEKPVFRPAMAWHQQYYLKNPSKYLFYRLVCGRDARLREIWGGDAPQ